MNRRNILAALGAAVFVPKELFGKDITSQQSTTKNEWYEKEFEFEGNTIIYYRLPKNMPMWFGVEKNEDKFIQYFYTDTILIPTFDLRQVGGSIEQNIREAIECAKKTNEIKHNHYYCHIVNHEDCNEIGILVHTAKCKPVVDFSAEDCMRRYETKIRESGQLSEQEIIDRIQKFRDDINSKEHLIADMNSFFVKNGVDAW